MDFKRGIPVPLEHHAYLIEGVIKESVDQLKSFLEKGLGISFEGNPDAWVSVYSSFGIDESRGLSEMQLRRPIAGEQKVFIIGFDSITSEAQNSLLKVFEEPAQNTHFFIVAPSAEILLPTLRSRVAHVGKIKAEGDSGFIDGFLRSKASKRITMVQDIISEKDKASALGLLDGIETRLGEGIDPSGTQGATIKALEYIRDARGYLRGRAPSYKLILENLALITPKL